MKSRVGLVIAVAVLASLVLLFSSLRFKDVTVPAQWRGEAASNPFYAVMLLSRTLGAEARWEQVFIEPPRDSVLVLSGWNWTLSRTRRERIEKWVEDGGRLVVDAWLLGETDEFEDWSGIGKETLSEDVHTELCRSLTEAGSSRKFKMCGFNSLESLTAWREQDIEWDLRDGERSDALRVGIGKGSVTMINGDPFRHRAVMQGDHMQIFLAATQLRRGDQVLFLTEDEQTSLLTLVWRFGAPAVLLLLATVTLALWRAGVRFGPRVAATDSARRSLAEQIRGTGQFVVRFGGGRALVAAANRALRDAARQRIHNYDRLSSEDRVTALAKASGLNGGDLAHAMNFFGDRNSHELRHAIAVLETARRHVLTMRRSGHGN